MKILSHAAYKQAERFLLTQARPLEQTLFATHLQDASAQWALDELAAFQNSDGGFGHGLEPDVQAEVSSVLATTVALQHLRDLDASEEDPLVVGAMRYLADTYDRAARAWPFVPPSITQAPRAPWWEPQADLTHYLANPRAEIIGYLFEYPILFAAELRESLLEEVIKYLAAAQTELTMHELLCYVRLVETSDLPERHRERLHALLLPVIAAVVETDEEAWSGYVLKPLQVAPSPSAQFAELLRPSIERNLDFEIERQQEDGSWAPAWSWGDAYPEAWPHARRAWQGVLTVVTLRSLSAYGRIERR
jgi:hypothetical protein